MQGLRTQEGSKFEKFFELVQNTAKKHGFVFFLDAGDGNDIITDELEGENLQGWIVPQEKVNEFEKEFVAFKNTEVWDDYFGFAVWYKEKGEIKILFRSYDDTGKVFVLK